MPTIRRNKTKQPPSKPVCVAEVLDEADELHEEAELLWTLSVVLAEFMPGHGRAPTRQLLIDGRRVTPSAHVVRRIQTMLSERSIVVRERKRDLLTLEVVRAP